MKSWVRWKRFMVYMALALGDIATTHYALSNIGVRELNVFLVKTGLLYNTWALVLINAIVYLVFSLSRWDRVVSDTLYYGTVVWRGLVVLNNALIVLGGSGLPLPLYPDFTALGIRL